MLKFYSALIICLSLFLLGCSTKNKKPVEANIISEPRKESSQIEASKVKESSVKIEEVPEQTIKTETIEAPEKTIEIPSIKKESDVPIEDILKFGAIDLQKVAEESIAGKKATEEYNALAKLKQEIIDEKRKAIENLKFNFEMQKAGLTDSALRKKIEEIDRLETELERFGQDSEKELDSKYDELYNNILQEILTLSNIIGEKEKYTLIFDKGQVLYCNEKIDITDLFIKKYDETKKPVSSGTENSPSK